MQAPKRIERLIRAGTVASITDIGKTTGEATNHVARAARGEVPAGPYLAAQLAILEGQKGIASAVYRALEEQAKGWRQRQFWKAAAEAEAKAERLGEPGRADMEQQLREKRAQLLRESTERRSRPRWPRKDAAQAPQTPPENE